jgi:hypothetical protein
MDDTTANCRRIAAACRVCNKETDLLQSLYHAVDRNGYPIYAGKCCACGGLNTIYTIPGMKVAFVQSFAETPADLRRMMEKAVNRFGFDEGA